MGTVALQLHAGCGRRSAVRRPAERIDAQATHRQSVLKLPPQATLLARSDKDAHQAFRWGESVWGVQFHPEFSTAMMRHYIHAPPRGAGRRGHLPPRAARSRCARRRWRAQVLRRFVRHARRHG
jgi:GMP synthase (glutamine-hydrolysing)